MPQIVAPLDTKIEDITSINNCRSRVVRYSTQSTYIFPSGQGGLNPLASARSRGSSNCGV